MVYMRKIDEQLVTADNNKTIMALMKNYRDHMNRSISSEQRIKRETATDVGCSLRNVTIDEDTFKKLNIVDRTALTLQVCGGKCNFKAAMKQRVDFTNVAFLRSLNEEKHNLAGGCGSCLPVSCMTDSLIIMVTNDNTRMVNLECQAESCHCT